MVLIRFLRFFLGYIKISVSGAFPERFLNVCAMNGYRVWNTHRRGENMEFCIFARDYKSVKNYRKRCNVRLKILKKYGFPFFIMKYKHRSGIPAGFALFVLILFVMPNYVWSVNINGNERVPSEKIYSALDTVGISVGTRLSDIDTDNMRLRLSLLVPDISWAAVNINGTSVNVDIRETTEKIEKDVAYSNIVASYDGVITALYIRTGSAAVKVGDTVMKGDLIVSGTEEYKTGTTVFRHSDGDVIAKIEREFSVSVPLRQTVECDTGYMLERKVFSAFGVDLPLYIGGIGYRYREEISENNLVIGGVLLPVKVTSAKLYEIESNSIDLTEDQAMTQAEKKLKDFENTELSMFEIHNRDITYTVADNNLIVTAKYICSGNIGKTEYFYVENQ